MPTCTGRKREETQEGLSLSHPVPFSKLTQRSHPFSSEEVSDGTAEAESYSNLKYPLKPEPGLLEGLPSLPFFAVLYLLSTYPPFLY